MKANSIEKPEKGLYAFSVFLAAATLLLIAAGGLVTSQGAGLSVPDWPLSFGKFFPHMEGPMVWEHSHRVIAGSVGILSLVLSLWITFREKRKWLVGLAWLAFGLVFLQALLGGLTVLMRLPPAVSIAHAVIGQVFLGFVVTIAFFLSPYYERYQTEQEARDPVLVLASGTSLVFVLAQLVLGSTVRHTQHAVTEHISFALVVVLGLLALAFYAVYRHRLKPRLLSIHFGMAAVVVVQVFLGIGAFVFKTFIAPSAVSTTYKIFFTMMHQTVGAVVLGLVALIWLMSFYPEETSV